MNTETDTISGAEQNIQTHANGPRALTLDKDAKNTCWRKDRIFNKWCREDWASVEEGNFFTFVPQPERKKFNGKSIKGLKIQSERGRCTRQYMGL